MTCEPALRFLTEASVTNRSHMPCHAPARRWRYDLIVSLEAYDAYQGSCALHRRKAEDSQG